jgi:hypothetical protein
VGLLDRFRDKTAAKSAIVDTGALRSDLVDYILKALTDKDGRVRAEDAISAAATIVAERCIDAAGNFELRNHNFHPGSRVFSETANALFCGDVTSDNLDDVPASSIIGILRSKLDAQTYTKESFPALTTVFKGFASRAGDPKDFGKVPLSVPEENYPFLLPLKVGYETRARVDEIMMPIRSNKRLCLQVATEALAAILNMISNVMNPGVALMLAVETINGMMKTAPMTAKALAEGKRA